MNGPEDTFSDWEAIDWRAKEKAVRRLRQRIFAASQAGDLKKVRNLQKLMVRSRANTLVSLRRVTEVNAGRKTAGIDGQVVLSATGKAALAQWVQHQTSPWQARPVKRMYPESGAERGARRPRRTGRGHRSRTFTGDRISGGQRRHAMAAQHAADGGGDQPELARAIPRSARSPAW